MTDGIRPAVIARRAFLQRSAAAAMSVAVLTPRWRGLGAQVASGQGASGAPGASGQQPTSPASNVEMTSDSYKPVRRPAKANAVRTMDEKQVDAFERQLACPCPCTLDVYTCRTTDFTCGISPAVHRDVNALVEGGYSADEIMTALLDTYGDFILMSPRKQGFNLMAWIAPFSAVAAGAVGVGMVLRRWQRNAQATATRVSAADLSVPGIDASPDELARLADALRDDRA